MNSLSDTFTWPSRDPQWISKILVMGLIGLLLFVPIVNLFIVMVFYGWVFVAMDNLRGGRYEVPRAGFGYLGRGWPPFVVLLIYGLVVGVVFGVFFVPGLVLGATGSSENGPGPLAPVGGLIVFLGIAIGALGATALALLHPAILRRTYYGGIGGGLNVAGVIQDLRTRTGDTLLAGLFSLISNFISQLGAYACLVGLVFTVPYSYAMLAGVVNHYDRMMSGPVAAPSTGYATT